MIGIAKPRRYFNQLIIGTLALLALYAPTKDLVSYINGLFQHQNIEIVEASFGANMPWQTQGMSYVKVSQEIRPSFSKSQIIYTRLRLDNPTSQPQTYRKIWLNFNHNNGSREYTTDYTLYNAETRQRLIGQSVQVGPHSSVDVIAAYRFIPSYRQQVPSSMSVSWEGKDLIRENACSYDLKNLMTNNFHTQCSQ
ncbi:hypothetical protein [Marinomonas spartinae]|uniref:hypothetical protein n=1 Tax=Marinomonas spartinae TaxID=1792290 RepID=UPI0018F22F74|nr:hypothetical protein [Marinomonas spartinae]MBJ7555964.1 hypothetical protein [Marinomonas spartinae]